MKKQYYFIIPILFILYLVYLIGIETRNTYIENSKITMAEELNNHTREINERQKNKLTYLNTKARIDREAKETMKLLSQGEEIIYLTDKEQVSQYIKKTEVLPEIQIEEKIYDSMSLPEKWLYIIANIE